jgi:alkylation response protein AidB-like acyl-CoA dehydrogenase
MSAKDISIVRVRMPGRATHSHQVVLRTAPPRGDVESMVVLITRASERAAKNWARHFKSMPDAQLMSIALQSLGVLEEARELARQIANSSDEQGSESYATKAHMRSWAAQMANSITALVTSLKLDCEDPPDEGTGGSTDPLLQGGGS